MTREEIIDGLQYTIDMFCFNPSTGEVTDKNRLNDESRLTVDACEGAIEIIKALEQQPCGNAIDRAEAIKIASGYCHPANVAKELAKLPSVTPQPKIGHWINIGSEGEIDGQIVQSFSCSECGAISIFRIGYKRPINSDLCPNCGCRMVEPQEI